MLTASALRADNREKDMGKHKELFMSILLMIFCLTIASTFLLWLLACYLTG